MSTRGSSVVRWLVLAVTPALACRMVSLTPPVNTDVAPDPHAGYIAGAFVDEGTRGAGYAFGLVGPSGEKFVLSFDGALISANQPRVRLGMISVPPGEYRVAEWMSFSALRERLVGKDIGWGETFARPFIVKEGHVVFLGTFLARTILRHKSIDFHLDSASTRADRVPILVRNGYPRFADAPMECVLCSAPPAGARVASAMPAITPGGDAAEPRAVEPRAVEPRATAADGASASVTPAPKDTTPAPVAGPAVRPLAGDAVLHFHSLDGDYGGWALLAWELPGGGSAAWRQPVDSRPLLPPTGTDDFGAYWVLKASDYPSGLVGYSVVKGKQCDRAGDRTPWSLLHSQQAWLNSGDPRLYFRQDLAITEWP